MVYGIIQLINFAHGEVFMVGAFAGLAAYRYVVPESVLDNLPVTLAVVLLAAMTASTVTALLLERLAYRPLRRAPRLAPLITAIGASIALQEAVRLWYPGGNRTQSFPRIIPRGTFEIGGVTVAWTSVFAVGTAVVLMVALDTFVNRTRLGKGMRATSQDPDTAKLMGIDTDRMIVIAFVLGGALAGVAGVIQGIRFISIDPQIGFAAGISAFTAAVLGGIGNIRGAVLGGFVLGVVQALAIEYLPRGSDWKDVWAFVVLILVLTLKPQGLLGERVGART
jgi:branched-chain amino acid transport system permease protein